MNWLIVLLLGICIGMHFFMHGRGHGHPTHDSQQDQQTSGGEPTPEFVPVEEESDRIPQ